MVRVVILSACLILLPGLPVGAEEGAPEEEQVQAQTQAQSQTQAQTQSEAKELSGMSIVGNDEAPKSLYIVPWKSSELGGETSLSMLLDGKAAPVDREVFLRQLSYHRVSNDKADPTR
jgi:hypothetical protein